MSKFHVDLYTNAGKGPGVALAVAFMNYEGIKYTVHDDLKEAMRLNRGQQSPETPCVAVIVDTVKIGPHSLIDYIKETRGLRCT